MLTNKQRVLRTLTMVLVTGAGMFSLLFLFPQETKAEVIHPVQDIIYLTNQARLQNNLPFLSVNPKLTEAAHLKAQNMLDEDYFNHQSPDGREPWDFIELFGYSYVFAGENLAINFTDTSTTFQAWMNSDSHRENILFPQFQEIGVATHSAEKNGTTVTVSVQMFGSREDFTPFQAYLSDANNVPQKTETLMDKQTMDNEGKSGYVASSTSFFRDRTQASSQSNESSPTLWIFLSGYCLAVISFLFYFTRRQLFFSFIRKFALFAWMLVLFLILT